MTGTTELQEAKSNVLKDKCTRGEKFPCLEFCTGSPIEYTPV